jgi:hypothetical protein
MGRIISYYANNGHISEIYFYRLSYLLQKSVDMLIDVTAGKLLCADNNPHWVAIVDSFVSMGKISRPKHIVMLFVIKLSSYLEEYFR